MLEQTLIEQTTAVKARAGSVATDRDVQRATLRDLGNLATECAATESEVERRHKSEVEEENKAYEKLTRDLISKYHSLRQEANRAREQAQAAADEQYARDMAALKDADEESRRKVETRHDLVQQEIKSKYDHAVWLGESVYDVALNAAAADYKTTKKLTEEQGKSLNELEDKGRKLLETYGVKLPPAFEESFQAGETPAPEEGAAAFETEQTKAQRQLSRLNWMILPRLFVGTTPYLAVVVLCVIAGVATQFVLHTADLQLRPLEIAVGSTLVGAIILGFILHTISRRRLRDGYGPLLGMVAAGRRAIKAELQLAAGIRDAAENVAAGKRDREMARAREKYQPLAQDASHNRKSAMEALAAELERQSNEIAANRDKAKANAKHAEAKQLADLQKRQDLETQRAAERHRQQIAASTKGYEDARSNLSRRLREGLELLHIPIAEAARTGGRLPYHWNDPAWRNFTPPKEFPSLVRFGELHIDLQKIADSVPREGDSSTTSANGDGAANEENPTRADGNGHPHAVQLKMPPAFSVPAALGFPRQASLLIQTDRDGRDEGLRILKLVMARLLTSIPPGRARFTMIDPVGLGENFAGFMHLADYDDALVGGRIWTETEQIEKRLADLTEHMETVIQKYLRNEYETIDQYNAQAGELAEPYRFLVIADFPHAFEGESYRRLASIATSGARCGVYTLILRDTRVPLPHGTHLDELERSSANIVRVDGKFIWEDEIFRQFPLTLDPAPDDDLLRQLLDKIGRGAKEAKRVELPFDSIAPAPAEIWSRSASGDLQVPIGRMGATRLQMLRLGKGVAQHALIAGKTGSGKSTLLHALITNLAMWYSPDEVEFYLVDFKKGVEFKTYATHNLPHARAIAVESDREFGLSVLQRLDAELTRRGEMFRKLGVQDLAAYRQTPEAQTMPRTLLIIDEFQEFFSEDDKLAQDAAILLDRLVRQGRAFGIHVLLGSQTIGGSSGLPRSTIGQMAVRIALQTSEADSQLILGDNNSAARLLSRPGEAIYNDAGGLVEGNSPFQVAWLPEEQREVYLDRVQSRSRQQMPRGGSPPIVFEGNQPADLTKNVRLQALISNPPAQSPAAVAAWIGDPVAIKDPTAVMFRRLSGANVLVVGQQEEAAMGILTAAMLSIAAQQPPAAARFVILDGSPADSPFAGTFARVASALPHEANVVEWRQSADAIAELANELKRRQEGDISDAPSIYVVIYALQRYRMLRRSEDSFSFGSDEPKAPQPDKQFADLVREGPSLGIHVLAWADTPAAVERTIERSLMREFDNRVLFQMSSNDSSNLIDSPAANKLGFNRALIYSEEQGVMEKFRPYAPPSAGWLQWVKSSMGAKVSA